MCCTPPSNNIANAEVNQHFHEHSLCDLLFAQQSQTDQAASILDAAYATQVVAQAAGSLCLHG